MINLQFDTVEYNERDAYLASLLKLLEQMSKIPFDTKQDRALMSALEHVKNAILKQYLCNEIDVDEFGNRFLLESVLGLNQQELKQQQQQTNEPTPLETETTKEEENKEIVNNIPIAPPPPPISLFQPILNFNPQNVAITPTLTSRTRQPVSRAPINPTSTTAATTTTTTAIHNNSSSMVTPVRAPLSRVNHANLMEHIGKNGASVLKSTGIDRSPGGTPCTTGRKPRSDALGIGNLLQRKFKNVTFESPQGNGNKENNIPLESDFSPMTTPVINQRVVEQQ